MRLCEISGEIVRFCDILQFKQDASRYVSETSIYNSNIVFILSMAHLTYFFFYLSRSYGR